MSRDVIGWFILSAIALPTIVLGFWIFNNNNVFSQRIYTNSPRVISSGANPETTVFLNKKKKKPSRLRLMYKHFPKAGGTEIKYALSQFVSATALEFKREFQFLPVVDHQRTFTVGSVRNPCAYYVSLWAFGSSGYGQFRHNSVPRGMLNRLYGSSTSHNTTQDRERFSRWLRYINPSDGPGLVSARFVYGYYHKRWPAHASSDMIREESNAKRAAIRDAVDEFDTADVDCWIKTESLVDDLKRCLHAYNKRGGEVQKNINWTALEKPRNPSKHAPCSFYFSDHDRDFVLDSDRAIFKKFGYDSCCPLDSGAS